MKTVNIRKIYILSFFALVTLSAILLLKIQTGIIYALIAGLVPFLLIFGFGFLHRNSVRPNKKLKIAVILLLFSLFCGSLRMIGDAFRLSSLPGESIERQTAPEKLDNVLKNTAASLTSFLDETARSMPASDPQVLYDYFQQKMKSSPLPSCLSGLGLADASGRIKVWTGEFNTIYDEVFLETEQIRTVSLNDVTFLQICRAIPPSNSQFKDHFVIAEAALRVEPLPLLPEFSDLEERRSQPGIIEKAFPGLSVKLNFSTRTEGPNGPEINEAGVETAAENGIQGTLYVPEIRSVVDYAFSYGDTTEVWTWYARVLQLLQAALLMMVYILFLVSLFSASYEHLKKPLQNKTTRQKIYEKTAQFTVISVAAASVRILFSYAVSDFPPALSSVFDPSYFAMTSPWADSPLAVFATAAWMLVQTVFLVRFLDSLAIRGGYAQGEHADSASETHTDENRGKNPLLMIPAAFAILFAAMTALVFFADLAGELMFNSASEWWNPELAFTSLADEALLFTAFMGSLAVIILFNWITVRTYRIFKGVFGSHSTRKSILTAGFLLTAACLFVLLIILNHPPEERPFGPFLAIITVCSVILPGLMLETHTYLKSRIPVRGIIGVFITAGMSLTALYPPLAYQDRQLRIENYRQRFLQSVQAKNNLHAFAAQNLLEDESALAVLRETLQKESNLHSAAYLFWRNSDLAALGFSASIFIYSSSFSLISSFGFGLPDLSPYSFIEELDRTQDVLYRTMEIRWNNELINVFAAGRPIELENRDRAWLIVMTPLSLRSFIDRESLWNPFIDRSEADEIGSALIVEEFHQIKESESNSFMIPFPEDHAERENVWTGRWEPEPGMLYDTIYVKTGKTDERPESIISLAVRRYNALDHLVNIIHTYLHGFLFFLLLYMLNILPYISGFQYKKNLQELRSLMIRPSRLSFSRRFLFVFLIISILPLTLLSYSFNSLFRNSVHRQTAQKAYSDINVMETLISARISEWAGSFPYTDPDANYGFYQGIVYRKEYAESLDALGLINEDASYAFPLILISAEPILPLEIAYIEPLIPEGFLVFRTPLDSEQLTLFGLPGNKNLHIFRNGRLDASTSDELFQIGYASIALPGRVHSELILNGRRFVDEKLNIQNQDHLLVYSTPHFATQPEGSIIFASISPLQSRDRPQFYGRQGLFLVLSSGIIIILAFFSLLVSKAVSSPIKELIKGTHQISSGELHEPVKSSLSGEFRLLAEALNRMASDINLYQEDLKTRRRFMEAILNNIPVGVIRFSGQEDVNYVNPAAIRILSGGEFEDASQKMRPELSPGIKSLMQEMTDRVPAPSAGKTNQIEKQITLPVKGRILTLRAVAVPLPVEESSRAEALIIFEDLTELIRYNKMAAWGQMARRIAHEVKNPLTPIRLTVEHLMQVYKDGSERFGEVFEDAAKMILDQTEGLRRMAEEFSRFARLPAPEKKPANLNGIVEELVKLTTPSLPDSMKLVRRSAPDMPECMLDPDQIQRALLNLVQNAVQSITPPGKVTITTGHDQTASIVWVSVEDTGKGIDDETLSRLFEPYFSTREAGSGLGLTITKKTVEDHAGEITVESAPGQGTTFTVYLPLIPPSEKGESS